MTNATNTAASDTGMNNHDTAAIDSLLKDLGLGDEILTVEPETALVAAGETALEAALPSDAAGEVVDTASLDQVVNELTAVEAMNASLAPATPAKAKGKGKKGGKKAVVVADALGDGETATGATTPEPATEQPEPEKIKRIHFANKVDRIKHRLGDKLGDYLVLEMADAVLEGDELAAKQAETLAILNGMNVKEKNRVNFITEFLSGKTAKLNTVIELAFRTLDTDGSLVTGDAGNLHVKLLAVPYATGTARSTGRNTINVMEKLKVIVMTEKQKFVANPNSLYLAAVNSRLGIGS